MKQAVAKRLPPKIEIFKVILKLFLQNSVVYQITIQAINRAKLITTAETSPIVFDDTVPTAGRVSEGSEFTNDLVWWGFTDHMQGMSFCFGRSFMK